MFVRNTSVWKLCTLLQNWKTLPNIDNNGSYTGLANQQVNKNWLTTTITVVVTTRMFAKTVLGVHSLPLRAPGCWSRPTETVVESVCDPYRVSQSDVWSICSMPESKFDTVSPYTSKTTHQSSQSKVPKTFYLSLWATLLGLMVPRLSPSIPTYQPFHQFVLKKKEIYVIMFSKNYPQHPQAIQINNPILLERMQSSNRKWEMCQHRL